MKKYFFLILIFSCWLQAIVLDFPAVGHGTAIVLKDNQDTLLIDTGNRKNVGQVLKTLRKNKVQKISAIFISHPHDDHYGGAIDLLKKYPVEHIYLSPLSTSDKDYQYLIGLAKRKDITISILEHNDTVTINSITIKALRRMDKNIPLNEGSLVLAVYKNSQPLLLACADIGQATQDKLLTLLQGQKFPVITAPHHGSHKPSATWLKLAQQAIIILQSGPSKYNYPRPEFLLETSKLNLYRTDISGNITIRIQEGVISVHTEK